MLERAIMIRDLLAPCAVISVFVSNLACQELKELSSVADDRNINLNVLPNLGRIDVHMDLFRMLRES